MSTSENSSIARFLSGKSEHTLSLFEHFVSGFEDLGNIRLEATKTMIAVDNGEKRIAWITQLGKNFIHVVFPFNEPFYDNLCFQKVGQVPGSNQFNHHFRMLHKEDLNEEVKRFMKMALGGNDSQTAFMR
ncbi:DUF5655 domain-containing protein [Fluviicola chungangensis]|uniref:Uncharacterized protein n=1 Tax=Fluviicola chungangensis TaxID=2597671 RepID=A0A556N6J8_9FLAO|nr:DUF5655 domain-containing protein [Fluviicola chungangensis]TSJ47731.1 hypothetical protein FO442_00975 [Fluviicola chungangensis]